MRWRNGGSVRGSLGDGVRGRRGCWESDGFVIWSSLLGELPRLEDRWMRHDVCIDSIGMMIPSLKRDQG